MTMQQLAALDPAAIGDALLKLAVISRQLGHASIAGTAQDYLIPHDSERRTPEWRVVLDLVANGRSPVIDEEVAAAITAHIKLPRMEVDQ